MKNSPAQNEITRVIVTFNVLEMRKRAWNEIKEVSYNTDKARVEVSELVNRQIEQIEIKDQIYRDYYK
jgi:hypothetical protein